MTIHEEYGVFGIFGTERENAANIAYYGLYALQYRGQKSCGIVVNGGGVFSSYKSLGPVSKVFSKGTLSSLSKGNVAAGHARYGTTRGTTHGNTQPTEVDHRKGKMAIAHSRNLDNSLEF